MPGALAVEEFVGCCVYMVQRDRQTNRQTVTLVRVEDGDGEGKGDEEESRTETYM